MDKIKEVFKNKLKDTSEKHAGWKYLSTDIYDMSNNTKFINYSLEGVLSQVFCDTSDKLVITANNLGFSEYVYMFYDNGCCSKKMKAEEKKEMHNFYKLLKENTDLEVYLCWACPGDSKHHHYSFGYLGDIYDCSLQSDEFKCDTSDYHHFIFIMATDKDLEKFI